MSARRTLTMAGAIAASVILAACGGTSAPPASTGGPSPATEASSNGPSPAKTASTQPAPRATEVNPSGDIPDNQAYVVFSPAGGGYSVKTPEGWARTSNGTTTSFTDKLNKIEVSAAATPTQPTIASVTNTDVPSLKTVPKFAMGKVAVVTRAGGSAILLTYQGDSAPDQVTGKVVRDAFERYTFYRAGKRVDLTLSGPVNADNVDPWRIVSDSLRWS
ncbi:MAG: hypothetical protein HHJ11_15405 [Phycicoccus sp.]|nr:hypothetical protein [Phycicoccus sp.]